MFSSQTVNIIIFIFLLLPFVIVATVNAQDPTPSPTPKDPEEIRLELEKKLRELEAAISTAEKNRITADIDALKKKRELFAGPTISPVDGTISVSSESVVMIETRVLAQQATYHNLVRFVEDFGTVKTNNVEVKVKNLVIYNKSDMDAIPTYTSVLEQLKPFRVSYEKYIREAEQTLDDEPETVNLTDPFLPFIVASGAIKSVAEIVQLFRTTTELKSIDVSIDEATLVSLLVKAAKEKKKEWSVFYPAVYPINTVVTSPPDSPFIKILSEITSLKGDAATRMEMIKARIETLKKRREEEKKKVDAGGADAPAARVIIGRIDKIVQKLETISARLKSLNDAHDQLLGLLNTVDPQTKLTGQAILLRIERLVGKLREADTYVVRLAVTAKGTNRITKNIWRNARITHSAGSELTYQVFKTDGSILIADSVYEYTPYTKPAEIPRKSP